MQRTLAVAGRRVDVEVTRQGDTITVEVEGRRRSARLVSQEGPLLVLAVAGPDGRERLIRAAGVVDGDRRYLWTEGRTWTYAEHQARGVAAGDVPAGSLSATIPAVVSEVLVAPGDVVEAGDKLLLLESMKMIMPIQAPYDGRVTAVNCVAGDAVQPGVRLVDLARGDEEEE